MIEYTVDPAFAERGDPIEMVLVQFDITQPGGDEFRDRLLDELGNAHKKLGILSGHYYDDAVWIYSEDFFSEGQIRTIEAIAHDAAAPDGGGSEGEA